MMDILNANRGLSTPLTYVLTLTITTLLVMGLITASGSFVDSERQSVAREEMRVIGERVAKELVRADQLAGTGTRTTLAVDATHPGRVVGEAYSVEVTATTVVVSSPDLDVTVEVPYRTTTDVAAVTVRGGDLRIHYDHTDGRLHVEEADS